MKTLPYPPSSPHLIEGVLERVAAKMHEFDEDTPPLLRALAAKVRSITASNAPKPTSTPQTPAKAVVARIDAAAGPLTLEALKERLLAVGADYNGFVKYSAGLETDEDRSKFASVVLKHLNAKTAGPAVAARVAAIKARQPAKAPAEYVATRAQFNALTPTQRNEWIRAGGKIRD